MGFPTFVTGRGLVDSEVLGVERVVEQYDERLYFDLNDETRQWCIYLKTPPSEPDIPVIGFERKPHPDDALKAMVQADALRQGEEILDGMRKRNWDKDEPLRAKADDAAGQAAEALEWGYRKMGKHPVARIFVPNEKGT